MSVLDRIPVTAPVEEVVRNLRLNGVDGETKAHALLAEARPLLHPKALYKEAFIEEKGPDWVRVEGFAFRSRVLRANLEKAEKVFAFVLTVGGGLEARASRTGDLLHQFSLETIADLALQAAAGFLENHLKTRFGFETLSSLSPGSLEDWPITEQRPLFDLLGDPAAAVGVKLSDALLMIPRKSVSGLFFPTDESFSSCRLCPRERCPGRRAPFDPAERAKFEDGRPAEHDSGLEI
ncbi:MAG: vitamin B12 dependent methionine synthase [Candidatus Aminicenantes bacterium]|nr:vitamin B12 dependent methionine synthase [Candidatus Aminicenantes bacterium]